MNEPDSGSSTQFRGSERVFGQILQLVQQMARYRPERGSFRHRVQELTGNRRISVWRQSWQMPTSERAFDRGTRRADRVLRTISGEIRDARLGLGLSQAAVASAARMSEAQVSRIERALLPNLSLRDAA